MKLWENVDTELQQNRRTLKHLTIFAVCESNYVHVHKSWYFPQFFEITNSLGTSLYYLKPQRNAKH